MNNIMVSDNIKIENMIYEIRGKQVMLDSDLAKLYNVETKRINEAVKNNIEKFPERYCFQLNDEESNNLRSKISTSKINSHGGRRYNQRVFTEQGVYMLATILKSKEATKITIAIMDTFVVMKSIINTSLIEQKYINKLVLEHDSKIDLILDKLNTNEEINHIFYEGQIYDAYSPLIDILSKAKKEIIVIDNYAGKKLFDIIRNINVKVKIYTENIDNISKELHLIDNRVSKEDAYKYIEKTDIVYLMGGSPQLEMKSIIEYNLFNILRNRDGITIGTSAGAMNQTDRVIYKDDFKSYELVDYQGLGFINLNIYPHFDIDNKEYMDEVFEVSKYTRIVGLPNESFIRIKDNDIDFIGKHYFIENGIME